MLRSAKLSEDWKYRYTLWRVKSPQSPEPCVLFIVLNPSTADALVDDRTVRRCVGFASAWGYERMCIANLFAYRATDPTDMRKADDPIGPENDSMIETLVGLADLVVAAWGTQGSFMGRDKEVRAMVPNLHYLRLTKDGYPAHPLYLPKTLTPTRWE